jgi:O-antigen biosynthesis protein
MLYSVVMPCLFRNPEHKPVVMDCLDSVRKHSSDYELIVVDDGSPLDTKFLKDNSDQYVAHKKALGIAPSWNDGIKMAQGNYIAIINDDIVVRPNWLEAMAEALDTIEGAMVSAPAVHMMPFGQGTGCVECRGWFPGYCFMLTKDTVIKVGLFDEQFTPYNYEDVDYWTRVYKAGGKLVRNYSVQITHKEGDVIHKFENNSAVDKANREKYFNKWGFDPIPVLYGGGYGLGKFPFEA